MFYILLFNCKPLLSIILRHENFQTSARSIYLGLLLSKSSLRVVSESVHFMFQQKEITDLKYSERSALTLLTRSLEFCPLPPLE